MTWMVALSALLALLVAVDAQALNISCVRTGSGSFYDFRATTLQNQTIDFSTYRGKVVLVTNVASF